ncbi:MAG: hypothetical protein HN849_17110, partial [Victivallales bacterium]|nr:hypothetical protein [Victivallales bacterium]
MSMCSTAVADLPEALRTRVRVVPDCEALNREIAREFGDLLATATQEGRLLTAICPVGPLDYGFFVAEVLRRGLSCRNLRTINMDEYLDEQDQLIPVSHPLSFRRFMDETFLDLLPAELRPLPENVIFPEPEAPEKVTE